MPPTPPLKQSIPRRLAPLATSFRASGSLKPNRGPALNSNVRMPPKPPKGPAPTRPKATAARKSAMQRPMGPTSRRGSVETVRSSLGNRPRGGGGGGGGSSAPPAPPKVDRNPFTSTGDMARTASRMSKVHSELKYANEVAADDAARQTHKAKLGKVNSEMQHVRDINANEAHRSKLQAVNSEVKMVHAINQEDQAYQKNKAAAKLKPPPSSGRKRKMPQPFPAGHDFTKGPVPKVKSSSGGGVGDGLTAAANDAGFEALHKSQQAEKAKRKSVGADTGIHSAPPRPSKMGVHSVPPKAKRAKNGVGGIHDLGKNVAERLASKADEMSRKAKGNLGIKDRLKNIKNHPLLSAAHTLAGGPMGLLHASRTNPKTAKKLQHLRAAGMRGLSRAAMSSGGGPAGVMSAAQSLHSKLNKNTAHTSAIGKAAKAIKKGVGKVKSGIHKVQKRKKEFDSIMSLQMPKTDKSKPYRPAKEHKTMERTYEKRREKKRTELWKKRMDAVD